MASLNTHKRTLRETVDSFTLFLTLSFILTGCQIPYLINNSYEQVKLLSQRVDIEKTLKRDDLSKEARRKLKLSIEVRKFAQKHLHLKTSKNYTSYVQLDRPYVTYVVNASDKFALKSYQWWFPIIGHVPYKGFFDKESATKLSSELQAQGFDTYLRGVTAYSTLGWFNDPILSSMLRVSEHQFVNTLIHEMVHATIYIKDHADFNEQLASYIGDLGTQAFYKYKEGKDSPTVLKIQKENLDRKLFSQFISKELKELEKWYDKKENKNNTSKERKLTQLQIKFKKELQAKMKTNLFSWFSKAPLNNAKLLLMKTYMGSFSVLEKLYLKKNRDFHLFVKECMELENSPHPLKALKEKVL